jgi:hypothetical protein
MKSATRSTPNQQPVASVPPLQQRRGLFWTLTGVLAVWIVALLAMYWFTVRPERLKQPSDVPVSPLADPAAQP